MSNILMLPILSPIARMAWSDESLRHRIWLCLNSDIIDVFSKSVVVEEGPSNLKKGWE
jgi:hypothetical protein